MKEIRKRSLIIFVLSFTVTLGLLYGTVKIRKNIVQEKMIAYSIASRRTSDNAENRVVMDGISGYVGVSVYLKYLEDGYIRVSGDNLDESMVWKLLSRFSLEPGMYTLTGMKNVAENTVALQLHLSDDSGEYRYLYQHDENVSFVIDRPSDATLHVMVYPNVEKIDVKARPAVYRDG